MSVVEMLDEGEERSEWWRGEMERKGRDGDIEGRWRK